MLLGVFIEIAGEREASNEGRRKEHLNQWLIRALQNSIGGLVLKFMKISGITGIVQLRILANFMGARRGAVIYLEHARDRGAMGQHL